MAAAAFATCRYQLAGSGIAIVARQNRGAHVLFNKGVRGVSRFATLADNGPPCQSTPVERLAAKERVESKTWLGVELPRVHRRTFTQERRPPLVQQNLMLQAVAFHVPFQPGTARQMCSTGPRCLYDVLGVSKLATQLDIKRAYIREAKKVHPDVNKSPDAAEHFRELADAYDILRDEQTRARYDSDGHSSFYASSGARTSRPQPHPKVDPFDLFRAVMEELGAEEVKEYFANVRNGAAEATEKAKDGDFEPAKQFLRNHKFLVASVVLPIVAVVRFPALVLLSLRAVGGIASLVAGTIMRDKGLRNIVGKWVYYRWLLLRERAAARLQRKKKP